MGEKERKFLFINREVVSFSLVFFFFDFFLFFLVLFFYIVRLTYLLVYLNGHPSCLELGGGEGGVNAFAIFIFSAQFKPGTNQSDKRKTPKFISKSLFTP